MSKRSYKQMRNLAQFKDMPEDEFREYWEEYNSNIDIGDLDSRIDDQIKNLGEDYDLEDLNYNDLLSLRELARSFIMLEDLGVVQTESLADGELMRVSAIDKVKKNLVDNISRLQNDLNITRKSRQKDKGESLEDYLPTILKKARSFLEERLAYIYCPECKMLVCNTWFTNWENNNELHLTCPRRDCNHQFVITSKELTDNRNKNIDGVLVV